MYPSKEFPPIPFSPHPLLEGETSRRAETSPLSIHSLKPAALTELTHMIFSTVVSLVEFSNDVFFRFTSRPPSSGFFSPKLNVSHYHSQFSTLNFFLFLFSLWISWTISFPYLASDVEVLFPFFYVYLACPLGCLDNPKQHTPKVSPLPNLFSPSHLQLSSQKIKAHSLKQSEWSTHYLKTLFEPSNRGVISQASPSVHQIFNKPNNVSLLRISHLLLLKSICHHTFQTCWRFLLTGYNSHLAGILVSSPIFLKSTLFLDNVVAAIALTNTVDPWAKQGLISSIKLSLHPYCYLPVKHSSMALLKVSSHLSFRYWLKCHIIRKLLVKWADAST